MARPRKYSNCCSSSNKSSGLMKFGILSILFTCSYASQALKFSIEPHDVVVPEGNSVLLPCEGISHNTKKDGKIIPKIRWRGPDGQDIGIVGDTFRIQSQNGSLYISSVEENRGLTGAYQCLLTVDGIGTIVSRSARVSIAKMPETNHLFSEIYLYAGQTAYFKCLASVMEGTSYQIQWLKDDAPLHIDESRMVLLPSGAIEIDEITPADAGTYQCNVTSGVISRLSSKSSLNIKAMADPQSFQPPVFLTESTSQIVQEGNTVTMDCVANGNPKPLTKWLLNGVDIDISDLDSRFRIIGTGALQIASIEEKDAGNYQCRASNSVDSLDIQAALQVQVPPKFIQIPVDKMALEKEELELVCDIRGKPTPIIQWLKNGDIITPNDYMQVVSGHNLRILGLINSDAGMFQCVGSNPAGSVQAAARLQIAEPEDKTKTKHKKYKTKSKPPQARPLESSSYYPSSSKSPEQNTKTLSKNVFESLLSHNNNDDADDDEDDDDRNYSNDYDDDDAYEDEDLSDAEDEGTIHPIGPGVDPKKLLTSLTSTNNKHNEISHFSQTPFPTVTRKYPNLDGTNSARAPLPGPPRDLEAKIVNPRFVALSWMEPLKNPDEVISYTVYYKMTTSERERKITTKSRDDQLANIQSLLPGKIYQFRVIGNSNHGPGESSNIFEVSTQPEENIAGQPQDVSVYALSHDEIHLKWSAPSVTNGNISKYRIYYIEDDGAEMYTDSTSLEAKLTDLRPYTEYAVSVVPFNQNGMGDPSVEITIKTYSAAPTAPPTNMTLETTSSTSITVRWEPPPDDAQNGQIIGYKIRHRKQAKKSSLVETTPANVRHFEIKDLDKMAAYQVRMAAMTINGTGPFTDWMHIETYENDLTETHVPGEPQWLRTRASAESIMVTWAPPAAQEIKVRGYILSWGLGIPDVDSHIMDENARSYVINALESNSEYVISLRARNLIGDGPPRYDYVRTRDDEPLESPAALEVPVGLGAITMSASSIVVYWTDTTLNRNQQVTDNRQYVIRYNTPGANRYKYCNTTDLNYMVRDLKYNTQYEFAVKVVKGRRESAWSMSVLNTTSAASPNSPPRDLTINVDGKNPSHLILQWLPPWQSSGQITGFIVFYTTDTSRRDRDWQVEAVVGETYHAILTKLKPYTTYYFKVQTRSLKGQNGPFSAMISHTTGPAVTVQEGNMTSGFTNEILVYSVVGFAVLMLIVAVVVVFMLCRRKPQSTPEHSKQSYHKNNAGIKPPDLWIHHDQMELKNVDKNHQNNTPGYSDGASSSGAMTLPRSVNHDYDSEPPGSHITNSLDKRAYVPGYMTTSMNSTMERPQYPRTQYNLANRTHVSVDPNISSQQNLLQSQIGGSSLAQTPEIPYGYDSMPSNYSNPSVTYAPGLSVDAPKRGQGHPLKSFSVPGPPSTTPVITNSNKHNVPAVTIRPQNASPYKKPSIPNIQTNRLQSGPSVAHSTDEIQRLAPSTSTEELNQEMANLEGLMKDLSAITANEFEC